MNSLATLSPAQLRRAADLKERIAQLQSELEELVGAPSEKNSSAPGRPNRKRKKLNAAARAKMAKSQKERWAKIKAEKQGQ